MALYVVTDGEGSDVVIEAPTAEEAAQEFIETGAYEPPTATEWVDVRVAALPPDSGLEPGDEWLSEGLRESLEWDRVTVRIDPEEPECSATDGHDWRSPHSVVGGVKENPGVWGHGGGVIITEVCRHCGVYRVTDTWATRPDTGDQGLRSVEYRPADERSEV